MVDVKYLLKWYLITHYVHLKHVLNSVIIVIQGCMEKANFLTFDGLNQSPRKLWN